MNAPIAARRWLFESIRPAIGTRVDEDVTLTIRPHLRSRMAGTTASIKRKWSEDERAVGGLPGLAIEPQRFPHRRPTGVGDQDLDRAEGLLHLTNKRRQRVGVLGVGDKAAHLGA